MLPQGATSYVVLYRFSLGHARAALFVVVVVVLAVDVDRDDDDDDGDDDDDDNDVHVAVLLVVLAVVVVVAGLPGTPVEVFPLLESGQHTLLRHPFRDSPRAPEAGRGQRRVGV